MHNKEDVRRLLKLLSLLASVLILIFVMCGCSKNYDASCIVWDYNKAMLQLPNGDVICGTLTKWNAQSSEYLQVEIDYVTYLTSPLNVCLIGE